MVSAMIYEPFSQVPHGVGIRFPSSVSQLQAKISDARIRFMDGREVNAQLLGRDPDAEVAFFKIETDERDLVPVRFDEGIEADVGEQVVVVSLLPDPIGPVITTNSPRSTENVTPCTPAPVEYRAPRSTTSRRSRC